MFDLPDQDLESWQKSLNEALKLPITHLSLYNLTIEPHTVFFKYKEHIEKRMPGEKQSLSMLEQAVATLESSGFKRYEISAFAKPGYHSVHNTGYWQGRPFLGFGPSAFSYWNGMRFRNISNLNRYAKALDQDLDPVEFREDLPLIEKKKELLAVGLRMLDGVFQENWPTSVQDVLCKLEAHELIEKKNEKICLTKRGILFHDTVAEMIFS